MTPRPITRDKILERGKHQRKAPANAYYQGDLRIPRRGRCWKDEFHGVVFWPEGERWSDDSIYRIAYSNIEFFS